MKELLILKIFGMFIAYVGIIHLGITTHNKYIKKEEYEGWLTAFIWAISYFLLLISITP